MSHCLRKLDGCASSVACTCTCRFCSGARVDEHEARLPLTIPMRPAAGVRAKVVRTQGAFPVAIVPIPTRIAPQPSVTLSTIVEEYLAALGLDPTERALRAESWLRATREQLGVECPSCGAVKPHKLFERAAVPEEEGVPGDPADHPGRPAVPPRKKTGEAKFLVYECDECGVIWNSYGS